VKTPWLRDKVPERRSTPRRLDLNVDFDGRPDVGNDHPSPITPLPLFYVARPRLLDLLDEGSDKPLTAIVAPAGAGKSVLLAAWVRDRRPGAVWIGCEETDREPVAFWTKVTRALRVAHGGGWLDVVDLLGDPDPDLVALVDAMLQTLADQPAVIVLDDVHLARDAGPQLSRLAERLPAGSRLVTGSRGDPPIAMHRLRASGRCLDIREADLRLTTNEVGVLFDSLGVGVSPDTTRLFTDHIDGWVAGVQMAAIALRGKPDPDRFLVEFSGSHRLVSDFLVEEVLVHQPERLRRFLLRTSVLDELEPGVCTAVTGDADAAAILRQLDASAMFVVPLGGDTYRYHHLFREMLRHELQALARDEFIDAHRSAAAWYEHQGPLASALTHLVAAGDADRAYSLLQGEHARVFLDTGPMALPALVTAVSEADPTLDAGRMVTLGSALALGGALTSAQTWLQRAERQRDDLDDAGRARLTAAEALLSVQRGDALRALELLADLDPRDSQDLTVIAAPMFEVAPRLWLRDFRGARAAAARTRTLPSPGILYDEMIVPGALSWVACVEGSLHEAERLANQSLATVRELDPTDHPGLSEPLRTSGRLLFERGDMEAADAALEQSMIVAERWRRSFALVTAATLARVRMSQGRVAEAKDASVLGRSFLPSDVDSPLLALLDALDARIALLEGDRERAERITEALEPSMPRTRLRTRLHLASHRPDAALAVLAQCTPATPRERVDVLMLRARCEDELGTATADESLAAAVDAARAEGFTFAIVEELFPLSRRLGALLRGKPLDDFATSVLDLLERVVPLAEPAAALGPASRFTDRERVVIRYLASRLTTSEIAQELHVSVNTVRTHTKAVYRKLDVTSRQDAVAQARLLGIN
jgi:LuxR family maltose regulon positive regulatory protein